MGTEETRAPAKIMHFPRALVSLPRRMGNNFQLKNLDLVPHRTEAII